MLKDVIIISFVSRLKRYGKLGARWPTVGADEVLILLWGNVGIIIYLAKQEDLKETWQKKRNLIEI